MPKGRKTGGRQKGTPNKNTTALKDMILASLKQAGGVEYLAAQADKTPAAYMALVGKVLPMSIAGHDGGPIPAAINVTIGNPESSSS